jgi:predicted  nucleic acid-binding Zn-ribbon protein
MHPDLQHLIELQDLDLAAERVRRRIADIPGAIAALDSRLSERTAAVAGIRSRIEASQAARREIDKDLAAVQGRLSKYKGQLMEVKTNKEYQAMQHEIQAAEQLVRDQEDRLLERMEEQDTLSAELKAAEAALEAAQDEIATEKKVIEDDRTALDQALQKHTADRKALTAQITPAALALFEQLAQHRKGVALSEARNGGCVQCNVRLRPQVFNEVRRMDALIQCDNCSRILYFVPVAAATQAPQ